MFDLGSIRIEWGTMLFQIVILLVLLWIVAKFAIGPAMKVLEKRQQQIENQISTAEKNRAEAETLLKEQKQALQQAREEAHQIIERAKKQSELEAKEILEAAQKRSERMLEEARAEITREKDKAVAELRDQVASLSVMLAAKVIEKELDQSQQQEVIDQFMEQVGDRL